MNKKNKLIILSILITCILLIIGMKIVNAEGTGNISVSVATDNGSTSVLSGLTVTYWRVEQPHISGSDTLNRSGETTISGLPDGTYYVYLSDMPDGYTGLTPGSLGYILGTAVISGGGSDGVSQTINQITGTLTIDTISGEGIKVINNNGVTVYDGVASSSSIELSLPVEMTYIAFITSLPEPYNIEEQGLTYYSQHGGYGIGQVYLTESGASISSPRFTESSGSSSGSSGSSGSSTTVTRGNLKLTVKNSSGQSIENASISIQKDGSTNMNSGETDSNGILEFSNIETGTYSVYLTGGLPEGYNLADQTGYNENTAIAKITTVSINSGETVPKDIIVVPAQIKTARVAIKAIDEFTAGAVGNVDIKLYKQEGSTWVSVGNGATYSTSNTTGECVLNLPIGTYAVNIVGTSNSYPMSLQEGYNESYVSVGTPLIISDADISSGNHGDFTFSLIPGDASVYKPATFSQLMSSRVGDKLYVYMYDSDVPAEYRNMNPLVFRSGFAEAQILCLNHMTNSRNGFQEVCEIVDIQGDTATINGRTIQNPAFLKLEYVLHTAQNDNNSNHRVAYQKYFWQNKDGGIADLLGLDDWVSSSTYGQSENDLTNEVEANANAYVNNSNNGRASISASNPEIEYEEDTIAGPFNVEFIGNVKTITVKDENGNIINAALYKDRACTEQIGMKDANFWDITSNQDIYVKSNSERIKRLEVEVQNNILCTKLVFLSPVGVSANHGQNTMGFESYVIPTTANATVIVKDPPVGNLKLTKEDIDTHDKLQDAEFILYKYEGRFQGWVTVDENGRINNTESESSATRFKTDSEGILYIENLKIGNYHLYEVKTPSIEYQIEAQDGYDSEKGWITCEDITIVKDETTEMTAYNRKGGKIIINKVDEDDSSIDLSAGFKLQKGTGDNSWLSGTQAPYSYTTYANATIYPKQAGETLVIKGLENGIYSLYEVTPPEGYLLRHQEGYDAANDRVLIDSNIEISLSERKYEVEINATNVKKISISGFVWKEENFSKDSSEKSYDSKYTDGDTLLGGISVSLMKKGEGTPIETQTTSANGQYLFDSLIKRSELENYYVQFNYSSQITANDKYVPVAFNVAMQNGSKAMADSIPYKDTDITNGIATTYTGNSQIATYGLGTIGTIDEASLTLEWINLGIRKIPETEYLITENLSNVKIGIKGFNYTYIYGGTGNTNNVAAPRVRWQNSEDIYAYTREIYPSDIAYDKEHSTQELNVDVTYRIDITNTTNHDLPVVYKEKKLNITSLTNRFDTNRYTLNDENWTGNNGTATIKDSYKQEKYSDGISPNEMATSYITFKVNRQALRDILNHPNGIIEENPTKAIATGYHLYTRRPDYGWNYNISKNQDHITADDTREAEAPYLIFKLGEERTVSGKVFEDKVVTTDGQKLGDGKYQSEENVVGGVIVELLDVVADNSGNEIKDIRNLQVSNIYPSNRTDNNINVISEQAKTRTDENGNYTLRGIVPGYYYLRFTYGDGSQKIFDTNENEIVTINAKDYKSTIIVNEAAKNTLKGGTDYEWYKKLNNSNSSVAIDNLDTRISVNEGTSNTIMAGTAKMAITVENTENDFANVTENGTITGVGNREFDQLYFGIIEQPKQKATIEKLITNLELTNSQGNVLYSGNPENAPSQGAVAVSDLDNLENGGSKYVRVEAQESAIYGSNIEITYEVIITNESDLNYYNHEYYWFGEVNPNKEVTLVPEDVKDYLDDSLTYIEDKSDKERIEKQGTQTIRVDEQNIQAQAFKLNGWKKLYSNKKQRDSQHPTKDKVKIVANRILASENEDMEIVSRAIILSAKNSTSGNDPEELVRIIKKPENINSYAEATLTIIPPTGENKNILTVYVIAGIISMIVLSTGIVIIKKKIL